MHFHLSLHPRHPTERNLSILPSRYAISYSVMSVHTYCTTQDHIPKECDPASIQQQQKSTEHKITSLTRSLFFCYTVTCTVSSISVYVFQPECALETCVHMRASMSTQTDKDINVDTVSYQMGNRSGTALILHQCLPDAAQGHRPASCPTPPS